MNRILNLVDKIKAKYDLLPEDTKVALSRKMDIGLEEYVFIQDSKSLAQASGRLSLEEATTIYQALGSSPDDFNAAEPCLKMAITVAMVTLAKGGNL